MTAIVVIALLTLSAAYGVAGLKPEAGVLAFLPPDHAATQFFHDTNVRFGTMNVALVGVETADAFDAAFLGELQKATRAIDDLTGIDRVLSLTNAVDFVHNDEDGIVETGLLIARLPADAAERTALRARVLAREHLVGQLIAPDAQAVVIYCTLTSSAAYNETVQAIRAVVRRHMPTRNIVWEGAPFVSADIADAARRDVQRLFPWVACVALAALLLLLRDVRVTLSLCLLAAATVALTLGSMALFGWRFHLMLSGVPIVVFAVALFLGLLALARETSRAVIVTGVMTTAVAATLALSDSQPLARFGLLTALGAGFGTLLAQVAGPGLARRRQPPAIPLPPIKRPALLVGALILVGSAVVWARGITANVDVAALVDAASAPAAAHRFFDRHFGGSAFIQVVAEGDMEQPAALRGLRYLADRLSLLDGVAGTSHIAEVLAVTNEAMAGVRRIPDTAAQVRSLYSFVEAEPSARQLVTPDRRRALLHVRLAAAAELPGLLPKLPALLASDPVSVTERLAVRLRAIAHHHDLPITDTAIHRALLGERPQTHPDDVRAGIERALKEAGLVIPAPAHRGTITTSLLALGDNASLETLTAALAAPLGDATLAEEWAPLLESPLRDAWRTGLAQARAQRLGLAPQSITTSITAALWDLDAPVVEASPLTVHLTGMPWASSEVKTSLQRSWVLWLLVPCVAIAALALWRCRSWHALLYASATAAGAGLLALAGVAGLGQELTAATAPLLSVVVIVGAAYAFALINESSAVISARALSFVLASSLPIAAGCLVLAFAETKLLRSMGLLVAGELASAALVAWLLAPLLRKQRAFAVTSESMSSGPSTRPDPEDTREQPTDDRGTISTARNHR